MPTKAVVIFDLDGTLCDVEHRRRYVQYTPKNWDAFNSACTLDLPLPHVQWIHDLLIKAGYSIIYCSGRSDAYRKETLEWLKNKLYITHPDLRMRRHDDRRPDDIVKKEILEDIFAEGFRVLCSFDDRDQVVSMWRDNGIPCFQVAPGNF